MTKRASFKNFKQERFGWERIYYFDVEKPVKEGWTVGVSNYFTYEKYNQLEYTSYSKRYNGIVDDLLDNDVKGNELKGNYVSGYALSQIQEALKGASNLDEFKNNIKKIKNNATESEKIDRLCNYWVNYYRD